MAMDDVACLEVEYAGLTLDNPIVTASATPGWDGIRLASSAGFGPGAVVTKTLVPTNQIKRHPRCGRYSLIRLTRSGRPIGMVNADTMSNQPLEDWLTRHLKTACVGNTKLFVSVAALETADATATLARSVADVGCADLLELNASCPMEGNLVGSVPEEASRHVKAVKESVALPVVFKLSAGLQNPVEIAHAVQQAGADGLVMTNSVSGFGGVDITTTKPRIPCVGGYSGPAIKPIVQALVVEIARQCELPIAAVGGVSCWEDVVEYILLGATVVQVATAVMWNGPEFIQTLVAGLSSYVREQNCHGLSEIRGRSLGQICSLEEYAAEPRKVATVGPECVQCGICLARCFYGAVSETGGAYSVDPARCDGCGLCIEWCPQRAIRFTGPG
jgi:dihydropyrimidine dehydrogenase (NAD+) subunit PreA